MSAAQQFRIVSLLPGATETVAALGLTEALVGRSHECDHPPQVLDLPVCTEARLNSDRESAEIDAEVQGLVQSALSIYELKIDVLRQLRPTHILTQDQCDVCAVSLGEVQNAVSQLVDSQPEIVSLRANMLTEVWADIKRVAQAFGVDSQIALKDLEARVEACTQKTRSLAEDELPTVAAIEWTDPLMAAGNWIPELIKMAGGKPAYDVTGEDSPYLPWESLLHKDPETIVILPCGFDLARTRKEAQLLAQRPEWLQLQAVQNNRVFIADGNAYFNRPGPRLVDSLEILAEILHPELFNYGYEGKGWQRFTVPATV